ncbi:MAG: LCP family protein [Clostridia bacterium]|nr:LCP family protein [Clostridia bacterium]
MKILIKTLVLAFVLVNVTRLVNRTDNVFISNSQSELLTYLVVGFDDAAENTDVIFTLSYYASPNKINVMQIPRDTYVSFDDYRGKINGFYPYKKLCGNSREEILSSMRDRISALLGIQIDGYVGFTASGFINAVDFVGGVDIDLPCGYDDILDDEQGGQSTIHLDGESAYRFVRYRKGFPRGDLERLDAQKVFIKAAFKKIKQRNDVLFLFFEVAKDDGVFFEFNKARAFLVFTKNIFKLSDAELITATLPGIADSENGISYYYVNKETADSMMRELFGSSYRGLDSNLNLVYKDK